MIEINLLPQELRTQREKISGPDPKHYIYAAVGILGLLVAFQALLLLVGIVRSSQLVVLNAQWKKIEPQRKELEVFKTKYDLASKDMQILHQLSLKRINWAEKLNKLSLSLPSGIWFNDLIVSSSELILKGSAVSLEKMEMATINQFITALKGDPVFSRDFSAINLNSFQVKNLGGYDTVDFTLACTLKSK